MTIRIGSGSEKAGGLVHVAGPWECPITAVRNARYKDNLKVTEVFKAAAELGLSYLDSSAIVRAADNREQGALRDLLLRELVGVEP